MSDMTHFSSRVERIATRPTADLQTFHHILQKSGSHFGPLFNWLNSRSCFNSHFEGVASEVCPRRHVVLTATFHFVCVTWKRAKCFLKQNDWPLPILKMNWWEIRFGRANKSATVDQSYSFPLTPGCLDGSGVPTGFRKAPECGVPNRWFK